MPVVPWRLQVNNNSLIARELEYNINTEISNMESFIPMLNREQLTSYQSIMQSLDKLNSTQFFLHEPAGTGKTLLFL